MGTIRKERGDERVTSSLFAIPRSARVCRPRRLRDQRSPEPGVSLEGPSIHPEAYPAGPRTSAALRVRETFGGSERRGRETRAERGIAVFIESARVRGIRLASCPRLRGPGYRRRGGGTPGSAPAGGVTSSPRRS